MRKLVGIYFTFPEKGYMKIIETSDVGANQPFATNPDCQSREIPITYLHQI